MSRHVMNRQAFYAVRVTVRDDFGSTATRDYVRGDWHIGKARFTAYAVGDLMLLTGSHMLESVFEVDAGSVYEVDLVDPSTYLQEAARP